MIYPENVILVPKVIGWITAGLTRAIAQAQEPYLDIQRVHNPMLNDPWALPDNTWTITLPDAYIIVSFPPSTVEYESSNDRSFMAQEAATQTTYSLATVAYKTRMTPADFTANLLAFYQLLYTWNTDAILVDKVHPEDIAKTFLFNQTAPTYANRVSSNLVDPDLFLLGSRSYDVTALTAKLSQYTAAESNEVLYGTTSFFLKFPGDGYRWETSEQATQLLGVATGLSYSLCGYLLSVFTAPQLTLFQSQGWQARLAILSNSTLYGNAYFSYLIRRIINS